MQRLFSVLNRILLLGFYLVLASSKSSAQVIPDDTLGTENSTIRSIDQLEDLIEGGAIRGKNLFHSFQEFSIKEGTNVSFANPEGVANIFSRIIGNNISEIFGELGVEGTANLFLINSNGIIFGENSSLNVNGSFLATTADNIEFEDGNKFGSATYNSPYLTINFPIGLGFGSNSGDITVNDKGHSLFFTTAEPLATERKSISPGLQVNSQNNLILLGGEVNLNGGVLIAEEGKIELGGIEQGFVGLTEDPASGEWQFDYSKVSGFGNINLSNRSWIDASNISSNTKNSFDDGLRIIGENITIKDESAIFMQNLTNNRVGDIKLDATESITISKAEISPISQIPGTLVSETIGVTSSNIYLTAPRISLLDGGGIISRTFGPEKSGDIFVEASEKLELIGISAQDRPPVASNILNTAYPAGATGITNIKTPFLSIKDGGTIANFVAVQAIGNSINIEADTISLSGADIISGGYKSSISSSSSGLSQGADLKISASNIQIKQGAAIASVSNDFGILGVIEIDAVNSIKIEGFDPKTQTPSNISSITFAPSEASRELFAEIDLELTNPTTGNSGNLNINTPLIEVINNASVNVGNGGTGNGGELTINADKVALDNAAQISASTLSGEGGNITLNNENLELLNQSQITASAAGAGDGGNITINSNAIVGLDNSNITANAILGDGGNIQIDSTGVFFDPSSQITASSQLGIDGTVQINTPDINIQRELEQVAPEVAITDQPLANKCLSRSDRSPSLILGGTGGLPQSPDSNYTSTTFSLTGINSLPVMSTVKPLPNTQGFTEEDTGIIAADTVVRTKDGSTLLVAKSQIASPTFCQARKFGSSTSSPNSLR